MATGKEIKNRIRSIKNTKKITKAMEMVSASKMKRAVDRTLASRAYALNAQEILRAVSKIKSESADVPSILRVREPAKNILFVLITSNRGLCGSYNSQIIKKTIEEIKENGLVNLTFATVGKKGDVALRRLGQSVEASFEVPESISLRDIGPLAEFLVEKYKDESVDKVLVGYTDFHSALSQTPHISQVLPISVEGLEEMIKGTGSQISGASKVNGQRSNAGKASDFVFEPGYDKLMKVLVWKLVRMQIYQMLLESNASEQSARMMAMKNASEAAGEMIEDLTLQFNKARQAGITQEISEISGGMTAMAE